MQKKKAGMPNRESWETLWINVNIATMVESDTDYGAIFNGALAVSKGKIVWLGTMDELAVINYSSKQILDGKGKWLTPGLIDCHTHIIYGGNRANEFEMRLQGKTYEEIAFAGGGILSTVAATRSASEQALLASAKPRLMALHKEGVTTVEIKSGYGLNLETEIKMLKVAQLLEKELPVTIKKTFLGAHAIPIEFQNNSQGYINEVCHNILPAIAEYKLADAVDVFCENIGFTLDETKQVFEVAKKLNLPVKIHAEQLSNMKGSELASTYNALSADHLEHLCEEGVKAMCNAKMTAVLLPGAYYFLRETQLPPIELFRHYQVPIAIATDSNPGSSPITSIQLMLNMACTLFKLTPFEALAGVTVNAAKVLGIADKKGKIAIGYDADIACWNIEQPAQLAYQFGVNPLTVLMKAGQVVI
ncbi:imidazolonepropionase [Colwellia sp. UCD-KL20]|uniref:imidazolonepropionase n=1 Tax=Colwellia sp. UCD-KL20 TaxID=1917165 RepID=UPI0025703E7F|nr:imidazolonepropionase [Colwellia sp. UCD-KL20]